MRLDYQGQESTRQGNTNSPAELGSRPAPTQTERGADHTGKAVNGTALADNEPQSPVQEDIVTGHSYVFPVTFAQQRLWFLEQLSAGKTSYGITWSLRLRGALDVPALEQSIDEIVQRHEILRTTFSIEGGEPVQVIAEAAPFSLPLTDIGDEAEALRISSQESRQPFDLEKGPLLRGRLLRLTATDHVLLLATHHIVFDGWSRRILIEELAALYDAFSHDKPSPLPDLRLQYADYAVWQRQQLQGATLGRQLDYWKQQLAGAPAAITLPTDRPRPAVQTFAGSSCSFTFSKDLRSKVNEFAERREATQFMVLLAAFQALLSRYSGEEDVVVGTPIAGRNRLEIEGLIGLFANTLVLRTDLSGDPTVGELVSRVKEMALAAYEHQETPFEKLVEELQPERDLSYNPVFQVLFALQVGNGRAFQLPGLEVKPIGGAGDSSKFDLSLFLTESPEKLSGRLEYNTDLFDAATIERMLDHYQVLLSGMVENPQTRISKLPLLTARERGQVLLDWNATARDYPRHLCLHDLFEQQAERTPDAVACIFENKSLSYRELNGKANQLAHHLKELGVAPGHRVGIYVERSLDMMVGLLGIQKSGAAYVPLDPAYPAERIRSTLEDAQISVLLTHESMLSSLPEQTAQNVCLDRDWNKIAERERTNPTSGAGPEALAYVIFTSGSTGRPKGVQVPHRAVVNLLTCMAQDLQMGTADVFPALASFAFDMSIPELYLALVTGGRVVIGTRHLAGDGPGLASFLRTHAATVLHATPTTWNLLLESGYTGKGLKRIIGAEALPQDLCRRLLEADRSLYNYYGPTETTVWSAAHHFTDPSEPVVVGRPLANTQVYILDRNLHPTPIGVPGEIYIGGDGVSYGYLNRPELTAEKFVENPFNPEPSGKMYKTGDLGRYLSDGRIDFLGRADHQVKVRGYRIELGEIETVLGRHPAVRECAVIAREDVPGDKRLVGYVVPVANQSTPASELRAWMKQLLPDYMVPVAIVEMQRFALTPNGKVDRKALPKPEYRRSDLEREYVAPRNRTEEAIAGIWAEALNLDRVGVEDNFFEMGGHSLLAVRVFTRIEEVTGKKLSLHVLFSSPTIAEIAALIHQNERPPSKTSIRPCRTEGSKPPIYAAHGIGGTVLTFRSLAARLGPDQPIYCLEAFGLDGSWTCLEDLAALYVKDLLAFQPKGPYHLIGSSFGGMVIFEMARQLHAAGHEVGLVGMLDSRNMGRRNLWSRKERVDSKLQFFKHRILLHLKRLETQNVLDWPRYSVGRLLAVGRLVWGDAWRFLFRFYKARPDKLPAPLRNIKRVYQAAGFDYIPKKYEGKITLFLAQNQDLKSARSTQLGWAGWAEQGVELIEVPGDHNSMIHEHAEVLAAEVTKCLAANASPLSA